MGYDFELEDNRAKRTKILKFIIISIIEIAVVILAAFLITHFGLEKMQVTGDYMRPTLSNNDTIIINKMSYKLHSIKRNDVVVVKQSGSEHNYYIVERVIGLPGEKVKIDNGMVYIDGKKLKEKYKFPTMENGGLALEEIELDDGEYFMLCDNRNEGEDSRNANIGNVLKSDVVGKAWLKAGTWSFIKSINNFDNKGK
ncbi:MAG: signal peptidase I [Lachnospiraceae bacterium]|nr:signal peptidase I [Lachnospiraceae bacterium]